MCNTGCGGARRQAPRTWTVTYPGGTTEIKYSATAAARAAQKVEGATYAENPRT